ncbi:MAG: homoserine kinase [Candidatus Symbiothrix sp.]|jgi:homoserine kinase|nr:homoserine kinase [Candidatus Symbiothrix sp.]
MKISTIKVPATTANLGPGFDSCGLALSLYMTVHIGNETSEWIVDHNCGEDIPHDASNLMVETALSIVPDLHPRQLWMECDIPTARGLGSSSAAIVAGVELANVCADLALSNEQKVAIASKIEGHPDNVAPAILGNFVIGAKLDNADYSVRHQFPDCAILAFIPNFQLLTSKARAILPKTMSYPDAVKASSIANVLIAALLRNDLALAGKMMELDMWHESYRAQLIPHLLPLRALAKEKGAYATCLSGAGPTVLVFAPRKRITELQLSLHNFDKTASVWALEVEDSGVMAF